MLHDDQFLLQTTLSTDENGDLVLDFPDELLQTVGWGEGDTLGIESFAGRIILRKLEAVDGTGDSNQLERSIAQPL